MSQGDQDIANQAGAAFRADLNTELKALASQSSGTSAPGTTRAYQVWADTTSSTLKRRNAADSGWLVRDTLDETFVVSRASNTILGLSDYGKTFLATSTFTQTLTAVATLGDGWHCFYRNDGSGVITLDPNASETIDGTTTIVLNPGDACRIACNGSAFKTIGLRRITLGTEQATTSGTSIDFTSIPAGVKRISIMLNEVSLAAGTDKMMLQIGDAGGIETTGYLGSVVLQQTSGNTAQSSTTGFQSTTGGGGNVAVSGTLTLSLLESSNNTWSCSGVLSVTSSGASVPATLTVAGRKATSAVLDRIRLTTTVGTETFDAGVINIQYE